jgi:hypothetical protein
MSYQVALSSHNVLAPVALEDHLGRRYNSPLSRLDTINAMVITAYEGGGLRQDFHPLRATTGDTSAYSGREWELRAEKTGADWFVYYLGIPDLQLAASADGREIKSLSVELVGTSPLTGREEFSGGVDIHLQASVELPLIPGFINLGERFFPTLLPSNFISAYALDAFEFAGRQELLLAASLQTDPSDRLPVSLGKHWDPKNWVDAVVENLDPENAGAGYFSIKGGCFYGRNGKVTHWFGGETPRAGRPARKASGAEESAYREAAAEKIRAMGVAGNAVWVFRLEAHGVAAAKPPMGLHLRQPQPRFSIRHPMLHRLLHRRPEAIGRIQTKLSLPRQPADASVSPAEAVEALGGLARVLAAHQAELHRAFSEPSPVLYAKVARPANLPSPPVDLGPLAADIRELYRTQGNALKTLEAIFDETGGYAAWDAQANPVRDVVSAYLAEEES